jgi:hypothetical protein
MTAATAPTTTAPKVERAIHCRRTVDANSRDTSSTVSSIPALAATEGRSSSADPVSVPSTAAPSAGGDDGAVGGGSSAAASSPAPSSGESDIRGGGTTSA